MDSIYKLIDKAILENGVLEEDFSLPSKEEEGEIRFAAGAMDGIIMYHSASNEENVTKLAEALLLVNEDKIEEALDEIYKYFNKMRVLSSIDSIQQWIMKNQDILNPNKIYNFACNIVVNGTGAEVVKFGLVILELFDSNNEELNNIIRKLALCDEFTLFCIFLMRHWENANDEIYKLAQKVKGWGRIFAVENIESENEEIEKWLLLEGWDNDILPQYSVLTCAIKGDIFNVITNENISKEEFIAIGNIITYLIQEGPVAGISAIEDPELLFENYLDKAKEFSNVSDVEAVKVIIDEYRAKSLENN